MLYIENLHKKYGSFTAVNNLSLHIPKGELFGFVGPNGAGKTTTIRIVCGLLKATSGKTYIGGQNGATTPNEMKKQIGYVPDFFGVYDNLKVYEYMEFFGSMYSMNYNDIARLTNDLLALVNLSDKRDFYVDTLSRGMKQRLCVARALLHNPGLLILDEPSSGLDPRARIEMIELLKNLHSMNKTIIISSHILSELSEMCSSIGIMTHGNLITAGKIDDIMQQINGGNKICINVYDQIENTVLLLKEIPSVRIESVREDNIIIQFAGDNNAQSALLYHLMQHGAKISGFSKQKGSLEDLFMKVTNSNN